MQQQISDELLKDNLSHYFKPCYDMVCHELTNKLAIQVETNNVSMASVRLIFTKAKSSLLLHIKHIDYAFYKNLNECFDNFSEYAKTLRKNYDQQNTDTQKLLNAKNNDYNLHSIKTLSAISDVEYNTSKIERLRYNKNLLAAMLTSVDKSNDLIITSNLNDILHITIPVNKNPHITA